MNRKFLALLASIILLAALTACGRSTPVNYYLLESAAAPLNTNSMPRKSLRVAQVEIPGYLNRNNIVSRVNGNAKLVLAEFHLWAEPVSNGVRRVIEETITGPLYQQGINVLPGSSESGSDYLLVLDVQRLDGNFHSLAVLECKWALLDHSGRALDRGIFSAEEMVDGDDYNILVATESSLLHKFGEYLATRLPTLTRAANKG